MNMLQILARGRCKKHDEITNLGAGQACCALVVAAVAGVVVAVVGAGVATGAGEGTDVGAGVGGVGGAGERVRGA